MPLIRWLNVINAVSLVTGPFIKMSVTANLIMNTRVLRVNPIRDLEGSYKSTTYESWHDSIMLI